MIAVAESIFGMYGDRTARSRMKTDGTTLRHGFIARGLCIATGESFPNMSESRTARAVILELNRGDVNLASLSFIQDNQDKLSYCMKHYIKWLIPKLDNLEKTLKNKFVELRDDCIKLDLHGRLAENVPLLYIGFSLFVKYALEKNVIDIETGNILKNECWTALIGLARKQKIRNQDASPTAMFIATIHEMFSIGEVYIKSSINPNGMPDKLNSTLIGYYDDTYYYFLPGETYSKIRKYYERQGIAFSLNKVALWKYMKQEGYLYTTEKDRPTVERTINLNRIKVIAIPKEKLPDLPINTYIP